MTPATELPERLRLARWDLLLQDYRVAVARWRWAKRRHVRDPTRSRSRWWVVDSRHPDVVTHAAVVRGLLLDLRLLGVNAETPPTEGDAGHLATVAKRIAAARIQDDRNAGRCLCADRCGHPVPVME